MGSDQNRYSWSMCPTCSPSNPTIWKFVDPRHCPRCGSATVNADHLKRAMPWGLTSSDDRHGSETGYAAGCRLACCREQHRIYTENKRSRRAVREGRTRRTPMEIGPSDSALRRLARERATIDDIDDLLDI